VSRIFISHSSDDREQAARLLTWLHSQGFVSTFLDFDKRHGVRAGADWERTLYRELSSADAVILILTRNWFASKWCFAEFAQARALGKAIFPLVESPAGETFVSSDVQHLDLTKDREGGLERLLSELTRISLDTRGGFAWDAARSPYPGLLAFDEADAAIYFGRDDDIRRLIERLNARRAQGGERLVLVLGASGSGKSSLLRAGVVPRLKRDPHNWIVLPPFRPQLHPLDELSQVVAAGLGQATEWRRWRDSLAQADPARSLSDLARDLRATHNQIEAQILLAIDQGEELFAGSDPEQTSQFFHLLSALLDGQLPFLVVMSLRSDFLGWLQQDPRLKAPFEQFSLKPMPLERVRAIIEGPAKVAGIAVDDGLVTAAIADARTEDALPLLAFALRELYDRFASSSRLTAESYRALGDPQAQLSPLENAVRRKADEILAAAKPSPEDLNALKEAFIPAMVRVNPEGEYVRRPAPFDSIPPRALPLIERLAGGRLLTILDELGVRTVEVAHEALLRKWPLLRGWIDDERDFLVGKAQLEQDLRDWENAPSPQKPDALLTGLKLTRARLWLLAKPHQLSARERDFVQASVTRQEAEAVQRERASRRILRGTIAAAAVLAFAALAAIWEWREASSERSQAVSRQLAAQSILDSSRDAGAALREAISAAEKSHTSESELALNQAVESPAEYYILHHPDRVQSAVFSPDGNQILTASEDRVARVWDAASGNLLFTLAGHAGAINEAVYSADGAWILTASDDGSARIWDARNGQSVAALLGHKGKVLSVTFSPDGRRMVTVSQDHTVRVWNREDARLLCSFAGYPADPTETYANDKVGLHNDPAFSPNGNLIVTAGYDNMARVWDSETGRLLGELKGHTSTVWTAVFSADGKKIVTASEDKTAIVWDAIHRTILRRLYGHTNSVRSAMFSPDSAWVVTASLDGTSRVWDANTGSSSLTLPELGERVASAAFSPDGRRILTRSFSATACRVWDARTGVLLSTLVGHLGVVSSARFSPNGDRVLTASFDHTARVWAAIQGHPLATFVTRFPFANTSVFSPDGTLIVTADYDMSANANYDNSAYVWNSGTGKIVATLPGDGGRIIAAMFSPDGKLIVTAGYDQGELLIWDAKSFSELKKVHSPSGKFVSAMFSPDSRRIVTSNDDSTARVWDAQTGEPLITLNSGNGTVRFAAYSPDGQRIVTARDTQALVWDATSGTQLLTLEWHSGTLWCATFSPDGKRVVTASSDNTARIWDATSGAALMVLVGHNDSVTAANYSPDGKRIVTSSNDRTARVWDAASGNLLAILPGHTAAVNWASFSADGKRVATASGDSSARVYLVDFDEVLALAKQLLPVDRGN